MAITLNPTAAQTTRVQQAVDAYNAQAGTNLTPKAWTWLILKEAVRAQLDGVVVGPATAQAAATARAAIETDLVGSA